MNFIMVSKGVKRLHDHLFSDNSNNELVEEILEDRGLSREYVDRLQYLLSISEILRDQVDAGGKPLYTHIGGYAVLAHLVGRFGDKIHRVWRTSHDLDMIFFNPQLLSTIENEFDVKQKTTSHLPNKRSYILGDPEVASDVELDAYFPDGKNGKILINDRDVVHFKDGLKQPTFYGIPVVIPNEAALLDLKLDVGYDSDIKKSRNPRPKDVQDIFDLVSVFHDGSRPVNERARTLGSQLTPRNVSRLCNLFSTNSLDLTAKSDIIGLTGYQHAYDSTNRFIEAYLKLYNPK